MLSPLPRDTDVPAMEQCLRTLEVEAMRVSQWEARLDKVPGACPTGLAHLHEVKVTMEAELARMFTELRKECRTLTPEHQQVVFQFAPNWQNAEDLMQIIEVDENDDKQIQ